MNIPRVFFLPAKAFASGLNEKLRTLSGNIGEKTIRMYPVSPLPLPSRRISGSRIRQVCFGAMVCPTQRQRAPMSILSIMGSDDTRLTDLPNDILLEIAWFLRPQDLLSLTATSRGLRSVFSEDVVWHQAYSEWPLDLPPGQVENDLDGSNLCRLFAKSLKLESMWGDNHAIFKVGETITPVILHSVHFLTARWLLTFGSMEFQDIGGRITLWSLEDVHSVRAVCSLDIVPHCYAVVAAWRKSINQVVIVAYIYTNNQYSIQVHSIYLQQGVWMFGQVHTLDNVPGALNAKYWFTPHICDYMVAWCTKAQGVAYVWILNLITKRCFHAQLDPIFASADVPIALIDVELGSLVVTTGSWTAGDVEPAQVIHFLKLPLHVLETGGNMPTQSILTLEDADNVPPLPEGVALEPIYRFQSPHFQAQPSDDVHLDVTMDAHHKLTVVQHCSGNHLSFKHFFVDGQGLRPAGDTIFLSTRLNKFARVVLCRSGRRGFCSVVDTSEGGHILELRRFSTPDQVEVVPVEGGLSCLNFDDATGRFCIATWGSHNCRMAFFDFVG
ncbi:hypothetical protein PC9H_010858 [Pleurotus ostreatus]|uniref:F-box domain-containing protein n=1 Tax=Pleurotus ostreatus TaxID=5322 RepID=A0A8H6ZKJ3_PLEOS|nr:uncharacterized protein PC9H_010858 [Pleurotus ostreatus]KAF7422702.1 hypothetical protein PC9H_010858 [Pleurotus ostreatus]